MHKLLTIVLVLALYAPQVAGLLAYSECEVMAMMNAKPDCDCKLNTMPQQGNTANLPDKHKDIIQRTDWKYIVANRFQNAVLNEAGFLKAFQLYQSPYHALPAGNSVFRPPCC